MLKSSLLFKKKKNSRVNNSRHFGIQDAKLVGYDLHKSPKVYGKF